MIFVVPAAVVAGSALPCVTAELVQYILLITGAVLLVYLSINPTFRARLKAPRLLRWEIPVSEFFVFLALIFASMLTASLIADLGTRGEAFKGALGNIVRGAAMQFGALIGYLIFAARLKKLEREAGISPVAPDASADRIGVLASGVITFLILLPIVRATMVIWSVLLTSVGLPIEGQDLVGMFKNAESGWIVVLLVFMAVVIAPVVEELIFRAGIYRFLQARVSQILALLLPSLFFAMLHVNWKTLTGLNSLAPLVVLAIVFSLAYRYTGRIGTVIVAHALFNLTAALSVLGSTGKN